MSPDLFNGHARHELRVLVLPPTSRDAQAIEQLLAKAQLTCIITSDLSSLCRELSGGAGVVIVSEEALANSPDELVACLLAQPVWSDLPLIVLSRSGAESPRLTDAIPRLGNVSVIERPVRINTLISLVRTALRARVRQYQVRAYIAEREQNETALRNATETAKVANKAKDRFLAVLSHELRTPLTPVFAAAELLQKNATLTSEQQSLVAMIRRNIDLEARLIDDLLDLTRISRNKLELQLTCTDLHENISQALAMCEADLAAKNINVTLALAAAEHYIQADPARLQQIIWNLLKNAVKFTDAGGAVTISTANPSPGQLTLNVTDTGVGITADVLPHIFDAFEQGGRDVTRKYGGLGLGLAITRALVEMHGGSIAAASKGHGAGATFTMTFPTVARSQSTTPTPTSTPVSRLAASILLVEDHLDTRKVMAQLLVGLGCKVTTAGTVAEALQYAAAQHFDLLISDIGLPDGTGMSLMQQIKDQYGIKGIALSGFGMDDDMSRSRDAGFEIHLTKPVNLQILERAVRDLTIHVTSPS